MDKKNEQVISLNTARKKTQMDVRGVAEGAELRQQHIEHLKSKPRSKSFQKFIDNIDFDECFSFEDGTSDEHKNGSGKNK